MGWKTSVPAGQGARSSSRRLLGLLIVAAALALIAAGFGRRFHDALYWALVLRAETLDSEAVTELVRNDPAPGHKIGRLWNTGRIPHRRLALGLLGGEKQATPGTETVVREALWDPDAAVRQRAFLLVSRIPALATQGVLQPHLADPDPEIRVAAIRAIPAAPDPPGLNLAARLLADPDPQVAKHAAMWLQKAAGQDFGIRFASPRDATVEGAEGVRTAPPSPAELGRLRAWLEVQPAFDPDVAGPTPPLLRRRPIADFELASLDGGRVRLSSYRGKVVILNFWATWCTACLGEIPTLNQLHRGRGERLVVLGIALDGAAHAHAGHDHGGEEEASHAHAEEATDVAAIRELVARTVQRRGLEYPVALDPEMKIGRRFDAGELPTQVVVDTEGRLVRRFVGPRQLDIFEAMVREAGTNP